MELTMNLISWNFCSDAQLKWKQWLCNYLLITENGRKYTRFLRKILPSNVFFGTGGKHVLSRWWLYLSKVCYAKIDPPYLVKTSAPRASIWIPSYFDMHVSFIIIIKEDLHVSFRKKDMHILLIECLLDGTLCR
jgi:hypothetical protein